MFTSKREIKRIIVSFLWNKSLLWVLFTCSKYVPDIKCQLITILNLFNWKISALKYIKKLNKPLMLYFNFLSLQIFQWIYFATWKLFVLCRKLFWIINAITLAFTTILPSQGVTLAMELIVCKTCKYLQAIQ